MHGREEPAGDDPAPRSDPPRPDPPARDDVSEGSLVDSPEDAHANDDD
jgi:hypothetical protein